MMGLRIARMMVVVALLVTLSALTTGARGGRRNSSGSNTRQGGCERQVVKVQEGRQEWVVSPGLRLPGINNGTQNVCQWSIKAPPGHGVAVEVVRLRLPRSRRCTHHALHILPALTSAHASPRPLARFCGRARKARLWKTTFSEIEIKYKKRGGTTRARGRSRGRPEGIGRDRARPRNSNDNDQVPANSNRRPSMSPNLSRAEKIERIKALRRLYQLKMQQNEVDHSYSPRRRFYRHLDQYSYRDHNQTNEIESSLMLDGARLVYDLETNTYGKVTTHGHSQTLWMVGVGEPTWLNGDPTDQVNMNISSTTIEKQKRQTSKSLRSGTEIGSRQRWRRNHHRRTRFRTVSHSRQHHSQRQYSVNLDNYRHRRPALPRKSLHSAPSSARDRNEITPRKPTKPHYKDDLHEFKKFGYKQPKVPNVATSKPERSRSVRRRKKKRAVRPQGDGVQERVWG